MKDNKENIQSNSEDKLASTRRNFLRIGMAVGAGAIAGGGLLSAAASTEELSGDHGKVKVLSTDGKLIEVPGNKIGPMCGDGAPPIEARKGIPGKSWVMVIDLSRCKNARKCVESCQHAHELTPDKEWLKVMKMQDSKETAPYWFPKPCFHCENAPCVTVCPVEATYKRSDGITLIDTTKCIGCKYCMVACPYSSRTFNWEEPLNTVEDVNAAYSPETSLPVRAGTVSKCDFCPDMLKDDKLPHCVTACPMGVIYFGDKNEDIVSNGDKTLRFSELMRDKGGYRYMEHLGTEPRVYYLPAVDRQFPFEDDKNESI